MGPSKVLTTFPLQELLAALTLGAAPSAVTLWLLPPRTPPTCIPPLYNLAPSTDAALSRHPRLQTFYPPSAHSIFSPSAPSPPSLAPGFSSAPPASTPPPDSLRVLQLNAVGLRARSTELLYFLSSHPVDLICIQESNLNFSSSFRIPGFSALRSDCTHSRSGILSSDTTHASGGVVIFVRQGLSFSELSTSSLSSLNPYSDYVGVNISPNNSTPVSFLNVYAPPLFAPPQRMAEPISSLPQFFPPPEIFLFWGTSIAITLSGTQEVLLTAAGRKYSTGSSLLTFSPSMTLTHPPFSIAPLAFAPLLTFPLLPPLLPFLAPGRCFRTWVVITYQLFYPSLSLRSIAPTSVPFPSIFRKLAGMTLPPTLTLTVPQQRNTRLFLFPLLLLSLPLWLWMRPNLPFFSAASNVILKPGGLLRWKVRLVKDARLLLPLTEVMKIARLTSLLLDAPRQSLPRPRLRHGRRLALLSHLGLILICTLSSLLYCWLSFLVFLLS